MCTYTYIRSMFRMRRNTTTAYCAINLPLLESKRQNKPELLKIQIEKSYVCTYYLIRIINTSVR